MLLRFLHHADRVNDRAADRHAQNEEIDCEWTWVEQPFSKEAMNVKELEKYMKEVTDPKVLEEAVKEAKH